MSIPVLLVISLGAGLVADKNHRRAGCAPRRFLPLFNSLNDEFTTELGGAVTTELVIVDDCGNLVNSSSVASTFTNRDRSFDLQPLGDGRWRATWVPRRDSASTTMIVNTADAGQTVPDAQTSVRSFIRGSSNGPLLDTDRPVTDERGDKSLTVRAGARIRLRGRRLAAETRDTDEAGGVEVLNGVSVSIGGRFARLIRVSPEELELVVPEDIQANTQLSIVVISNGLSSAPEPILVGQ